MKRGIKERGKFIADGKFFILVFLFALLYIPLLILLRRCLSTQLESQQIPVTRVLTTKGCSGKIRLFFALKKGSRSKLQILYGG